MQNYERYQKDFKTKMVKLPLILSSRYRFFRRAVLEEAEKVLATALTQLRLRQEGDGGEDRGRNPLPHEYLQRALFGTHFHAYRLRHIRAERAVGHDGGSEIRHRRRTVEEAVTDHPRRF